MKLQINVFMPDIFGRTGRRPTVACDIVVLSGKTDRFVLLVKRGKEPFKGKWALPGGFMEWGESCEQCAARELNEETSLKDVDLKLLGVFSEPGRDPRGTIVSVAYIGEVDQTRVLLCADDDAVDAAWFSVKTLPELGFDHADIIEKALAK